MAKVGIVGASGYAGAELLRLCAAHPDLEVAWATGETSAGTLVADIYPSLAAAVPGLVFERYEPAMADGLDVVFLALPHGASGSLVGDLRTRAGVVVDLAADFRLKDAALYPRWYGEDHPAPALLAKFAYGLVDHRHTPEIEQACGATVLFTPHLAPMDRGILATCYARPTGATSTADLLDLFRTVYGGERFVVVTDQAPSTKATTGSNCAHLTARFDERTGYVLVLCAIDNLLKGASGQAVQCANLALGLDEGTGLPLAGRYP